MILTRLEDEVVEARAQLDRTLRKFRTQDDSAVVRARETLEALEQRLDRIDRVLVDVVETYPTMVDFSGGPANDDQSIQRIYRSGQSETVPDGDSWIKRRGKSGSQQEQSDPAQNRNAPQMPERQGARWSRATVRRIESPPAFLVKRPRTAVEFTARLGEVRAIWPRTKGRLKSELAEARGI